MIKTKELDKIIDKISFLGVPGLVFLIIMSFSPWAGGAAIMSTLSILGGPFGAIAGIGVLLVFSKYGSKISSVGYNKVISMVIARMKKNGKTKDEIVGEINKFPISEELKEKVIREIINPPPYSGIDVSEPDDIDPIFYEGEEAEDEEAEDDSKAESKQL
mgnify:CR=1 FL=1